MNFSSSTWLGVVVTFCFLLLFVDAKRREMFASRKHSIDNMYYSALLLCLEIFDL